MGSRNSDLKSRFINFLAKKAFPWIEELLPRLLYTTRTSRFLDRLHVSKERRDSGTH